MYGVYQACWGVSLRYSTSRTDWRTSHFAVSKLGLQAEVELFDHASKILIDESLRKNGPAADTRAPDAVFATLRADLQRRVSRPTTMTTLRSRPS